MPCSQRLTLIFCVTVMTKPPVATVTDKVKNRLEQLDDFEEVRDTIRHLFMASGQIMSQRTGAVKETGTGGFRKGRTGGAPAKFFSNKIF